MQGRKLFLKIRIEIIGSNFIIEDGDMSIDLTKSDEEQYNTCEVTIYNLKDETFNEINNKTTGARIYVDIDGSGYALLFQGNLRQLQKRKKVTKTKTGKTRKTKSTPHYNTPSILRKQDNSDIETILTFEDGIKKYYLDNYISKSYSGKITNKTILQDILQTTKRNGIEISANFDDIQEKTYPNGKIVQGSFKSIVQSLCRDGNCDCKINNEVLLIRNKKIEGSEFAYILDGNNCPKPEPQSDKKIKISAPFLPTLDPLEYVYLDFEDFSGIYKVKSIETKIDNFGKNYETEVIVIDKG